MSTTELGGRHPLCDCPEVTFAGGPSAEQVAACRERSWGITHPVLAAADLRQIARAGAASDDRSR